MSNYRIRKINNNLFVVDARWEHRNWIQCDFQFKTRGEAQAWIKSRR